MDAVQGRLPQGWQQSDLVDLKATVRVRSGASGDDMILVPELIPYECDEDGKACDPDNDVLDDPPKPDGLRGNTDCEPVGPANPCGRFIFVPTSTDCEPDGECAHRGKIDQCIVHRFCVTGALRIELEEVTAQYTADVQGEDVLFGWDDESTGATTQEGGNNDGTWILPPAVYEEPTGSIGLRVTVEGLPAAFECTMGVDSQGPLGVGNLDALSSPTPDSELIAVPIQTR